MITIFSKRDKACVKLFLSILLLVIILIIFEGLWTYPLHIFTKNHYDFNGAKINVPLGWFVLRHTDDTFDLTNAKLNKNITIAITSDTMFTSIDSLYKHIEFLFDKSERMMTLSTNFNKYGYFKGKRTIEVCRLWKDHMIYSILIPSKQLSIDVLDFGDNFGTGFQVIELLKKVISFKKDVK